MQPQRLMRSFQELGLGAPGAAARLVKILVLVLEQVDRHKGLTGVRIGRLAARTCPRARLSQQSAHTAHPRAAAG